jgi:hypothetical protein
VTSLRVAAGVFESHRLRCGPALCRLCGRRFEVVRIRDARRLGVSKRMGRVARPTAPRRGACSLGLPALGVAVLCASSNRVCADMWSSDCTPRGRVWVAESYRMRSRVGAPLVGYPGGVLTSCEFRAPGA